jgi:hypothetical protein
MQIAMVVIMSHLRVPFAPGPFGPWPPEPQCPASRRTRAMAAVRPVRWSRSPEQQRNPKAVRGGCSAIRGTSHSATSALQSRKRPPAEGRGRIPPAHAAGEQPSKGSHGDALASWCAQVGRCFGLQAVALDPGDLDATVMALRQRGLAVSTPREGHLVAPPPALPA